MTVHFGKWDSRACANSKQITRRVSPHIWEVTCEKCLKRSSSDQLTLSEQGMAWLKQQEAR